MKRMAAFTSPSVGSARAKPRISLPKPRRAADKAGNSRPANAPRTTTALHSSRAFLLECLNRSTQPLAVPGEPSDEMVHELRKSLKRARAALRLMRCALGRESYGAANAVLRDAGGYFREVRDSATLPVTLDSLAQRHNVGSSTLERPRKILRANRLRARRDLFRAPEGLEPPRRLIADLRDRMASWNEIADPDGSVAASGLRRTYRNARRALANARAQRTTEALHEWRKQVKYLQNALHALFRHPDGRTAKFAERVSQLADTLGDEHDLAVLAQELQGVEYAAVNARALESLFGLIARDRRKLQKHAFTLARKIYRRKPRRFVERLGFPCAAAQAGRMPAHAHFQLAA